MRLVCFDFFTHLGGAQRSTTEFLGRLHKHKHLITFVDAYGALPEHEEWVKQLDLEYHALHRKAHYVTIGFEDRPFIRMLRTLLAMPSVLVVAFRLRRYLRDQSADALLTISAKALFVLAFATSGMKLRVFFWCHGNKIPRVLLQKRWGLQVDRFFCLSSTAKAASIYPGVATNKISILPNSIDVDALCKTSELPLLKPLPDLHKPIRLLFPATLLPAKGQDCAIRALGRLVKEGYDAILYLAGDSSSSDVRYRDALTTLASQEGVLERVHFLGWRHDIPQILRHSTAMLLLSHSEGMPLSVMEAMALRCPVICTPVGSVREILKDGELGRIVDIDDFCGASKAVIDIINDPAVEKMLDVARESIAERYSPRIQLIDFESEVKSDPQV